MTQVDGNVLMDRKFVDAVGYTVAAGNLLIIAELTNISGSDLQTSLRTTLY